MMWLTRSASYWLSPIHFTKLTVKLFVANPPQLIGNALLSVAADNPKRSFARLLIRWKIYQAWANKEPWPEKIPQETKTEQEKQNVKRLWAIRRAKGALKDAEVLSRELNEKDIPERINDSVKAELLLGYMAGPDRETAGNIQNPKTEEA